MKILDRLPIAQVDTLADVGGQRVRLKKDEIIVWVSLHTESSAHWNPAAARFPAILDTGHTHNFAIQEQHLIRWAGLHPETMRLLGHIRHSGKRMPLLAANLWLYPNKPGEMAVCSDEPLFLTLLYGIAAYPDAEKYPRLPLLGLRAILSNNLHLTINGEHASVTLRTPDWRTRLLSWLA